MRKMAALIAASGLLVPSLAWSADLGVYGTTIVRIEERGAPGSSKDRVVPGTQFLGMDATGLGDGNLSLHLYGWGRYDFDNKSYNNKDQDGELTFGYLRYRFPKANAEVKAGRLFVMEGVANEQLDGLSARADLAANLTLSLYGGAPVRFTNDNKGDIITGSRLAFRIPGILEVGGSTLYEQGATSQKYFPGVTPPVFIVEDYRLLAGADIWLSPVSMVELSGHTSYNVATSAIAEHSYRLQVTPMNQLILTGTYNERLFKGYFSGTNMPDLFKPEQQDNSRAYGGTVTMVLAKPVTIIADYTHIHRDTVGGTDRYGAEARFSFTEAKVQAGVSYHRVEAPQVTNLVTLPPYDLSYHEARGWVRFDPGRYFVSLDAIGHFYDDSNNPNLNGEENSYQVSASAGFRINDMVTVSGDVSYGENPQYTEEFKGLARLTFAYDMTSKGGKK